MGLNLKEQKSKKVKKKASLQNQRIIAYIALVFILLYIIYAIYLLIKQPTNVFTIENGNLYQEETDIGYVIRYESVIKGENYKNGMVQIKSEGDRAAKDENVFRYYSNNEEDLKEKIEKLDIEIGKAIEGQSKVYSADIQLLDKQIEGYLNKLLSTNNIIALKEYKTNISDILIKKAKIVGELSPSGANISKLIEQRRKYEEELNNGQEYVKAPMSGIISYKVDNLEEELSPSNFSNFNKKLLESYNLKTGQIVPTSLEKRKNSK